jgi:hypothetical protein
MGGPGCPARLPGPQEPGPGAPGRSGRAPNPTRRTHPGVGAGERRHCGAGQLQPKRSRGGGRGAGTSVDSPRWVRIFRMTTGSSIVAITTRAARTGGANRPGNASRALLTARRCPAVVDSILPGGGLHGFRGGPLSPEQAQVRRGEIPSSFAAERTESCRRITLSRRLKSTRSGGRRTPRAPASAPSSAETKMRAEGDPSSRPSSSFRPSADPPSPTEEEPSSLARVDGSAAVTR